MPTSTSLGKLVNAKQGLVDRKIYSDQDIYKQELEQIFGRCWLFLGHESQVANPNDFIAVRMGEDPVLLTRDSKGKLHAFLNMCRHRGNRVCRADLGNAPSFMCTYHGWTFATDGKLVGVPGYKEAYFEELDRSQWGLVETAQIASYKGLVFATWDPTAPSLLDYLGDMAWYLDTIIDNRAGRIEFLKGVTKEVYPVNWKFPIDNNGGDSYHSPITHFSSTSVMAATRGQSYVPKYDHGTTRPVHAGNGHIMTGAGFAPGTSRPLVATSGAIERYQIEHMPERIQRLGEFRATHAGIGGVFSLFPNFSYAGEFRIYHPQGPFHTEVWYWVWADKDAPQEVKDEKRRRHILTHGPSGMREEEDGSNWKASTDIAKSVTALKYVQNLQLGIGHEDRDERFPGFVSLGPNEVNQRFFYKRWGEIMDAPSWSQITIDPITYHKVVK